MNSFLILYHSFIQIILFIIVILITRPKSPKMHRLLFTLSALKALCTPTRFWWHAFWPSTGSPKSSLSKRVCLIRTKCVSVVQQYITLVFLQIRPFYRKGEEQQKTITEHNMCMIEQLIMMTKVLINSNKSFEINEIYEYLKCWSLRFARFVAFELCV